jgi:hypothetical protein
MQRWGLNKLPVMQPIVDRRREKMRDGYAVTHFGRCHESNARSPANYYGLKYYRRHPFALRLLFYDLVS